MRLLYIDLCKTRGISLTAEPSNLREGGYETELPLIGLSNWTATIGYPIAPVLPLFLSNSGVCAGSGLKVMMHDVKIKYR